MAQYRAIFQNAYFKGLATAAVVTMGLTAGQAQAAAVDSDGWTKLTGDTNVIENAETLKLSGASLETTNEFTLTITSSGDSVIQSGAATAKNATIIYNNEDTANGKLDIKLATTAGSLDVKKFDLKQGKVNIDGAASALKARTLNVGDSSGDALTSIITIGNGSVLGDAIADSGAADALTNITVNSDGHITNAKATAATEAVTIHAAKLDINGGKISNVDPDSKPDTNNTTTTINLASGSLTNDGVIEVAANGTVNLNFTEHKITTSADDETELHKEFKVDGGKLDVKGKLIVSGAAAAPATLNIKSVSEVKGSGDLIVSGAGTILETDLATVNKVAKGAKLNISGATLDLGSSTLDLTDSATEANKIVLAHDTADVTTGKIQFTANSTLKAINITLDKDFGAAATVDADILNVNKPAGSDSITLANTSLKVEKELNVNVGTLKTAKAITLGESSIKATNDKIAELAEAGSVTNDQKIALHLANTGVINTSNGDNQIVLSGSGPMHITNGDWKNNANIVIGEGTTAGSLVVGSGSTATARAASLKFNNGSKLTLTSGSITLGASTPANAPLSATLDLSDVADEDLTLTKGTINVYKNASLIADGAQASKLVGSQVQTFISSGGIVELKGESTLKQVHLSGHTAAVDGKIVFNGATGNGLLATLKADELTITDASAAVDIGQYGAIKANKLVINNFADGAYKAVALGAGQFTVKDELSSTQPGLNLTLGENSVVTLGTLSKDADGAWSADTQTGTSNFKYKLTDAAAALNVNAGTWTLNTAQKANEFDIDLTNGSLTVGDVNKHDTNGDLVGATLVAGKVNQTADGKITINEGSKATFTEFKSLGTAEKTLVNGTLTLVGKETAYVAEDQTVTPKQDEVLASYGVSLNEVKVSGPTAVLELQKTALDAIDSIAKKDTQAPEVTVNYKQNKPTGGADLDVVAGAVTLEKFGTLSLDLSGLGESMSLEQIAAVRKEFTNSTEALPAGFIDLNGMKISDVDFVDEAKTQIDIDELSKFKDFTDIVVDQLTNSTVVNVDANKVVQGNVGNIQAAAGVTEVQVGQATLNKGQNGFATNKAGELVNMKVNGGAHLGLIGGGKAGKITLENSDTGRDTTLLVSGGNTTIAKIDGKTNQKTAVELASGVTTVENGVKVGKLNSQLGADLVVNKGNLELTATDTNLESKFLGNVQVLEGEAITNHDVTLLGSDNKFVNLTAKAGSLGFAGSTTVSGLLKGASGEEINVGYYDESDPEANLSGQLKAELVNLNGATLFLDPAYGSKASTAEIGSFTTKTSKEDISTVNGNIYVGQNSALLVGSDLAEGQRYIARLQDANGSFNKDNVGSVLYVNAQQVLKDNNRIVVDADLNDGNLSGVNGHLATKYTKTRTYTSATGASVTDTPDLYIGKNSVLALGDGANKADGAIKFESADASIFAEVGGKIVLDGASYIQGSRNVVLFTDGGTKGTADGVKVLENNIEVETSNGLLHFVLQANTETTGGKLELNQDKLDTAFNGASAPMRDFLIGYTTLTSNWQESIVGQAEPEQKLLGDLETKGYVEVDAKTGNIVLSKKGQDYNAQATNPADKINPEDYALDADKNIHHIAYNDFLESVSRYTNGAAADQAARMGDFGGAAETALVATSTTYDAVAGRFGMGQQAGTMTIANNGQGSGLWVTPVYKSHESDGFDADGLGYGSDITLYGVALGGDVTLANGVRVGAMFNVGSGDADGQGAASVVSNDFDYFGGSIYAGYAIDNFSIVGDVSYTTIDSDVEANTAAGKTSTSFDTSALSVGVTGQYALKVAEMDVTPHAGMRFTRIDMDDYTIESADFGKVGQYNASSANVFSIPVGVTISKEYVTDTWTVKPSFDLTLTGNFGDDTVDGTVSWTGVSNYDVSTKAEFVDNFTYGAAVGIAAKTGNFGLGLGVNYTGSSNTDEFGVNANARYMF